ncbi:MAG: hypothetical protein G01um101420_152 [Parcubacteria group bacterium Gr01-1014_20]|nr:MAG: hypothetical protein G01um101420_152 [Parcubacteria group bacterium Gr01-1014_20]
MSRTRTQPANSTPATQQVQVSQTQAQPTDSTPALPKVEGVPGWILWVLALAVLLILGFQLVPKLYDKVTRMSGSTLATTADTLGCSSGGYIEPNHRGTTRYVIMPRNCWTDVIYRPRIQGRLTPAFWGDTKGRLEVQVGYGNDRWENALMVDPGDNTKFKGITTMRFKNTGSQPVVVDVTVS